MGNGWCNNSISRSKHYLKMIHDIFKKIKESWKNIWIPRLQEGKTKVDLERDKQYEIKWVWYHTLLAIELAIANVLLLWIAIEM